MQAVSDRVADEKMLVDFIVEAQGSQQHLSRILRGNEPSKWLDRFQEKSSSFRVPVYLESEEQQDALFSYIERFLRTVQTAFPIRDRVQFILDVLFPESIIHALAALQGVSGQEAEDLFLGGPEYNISEVEEFNRKIGQQLKKEGML
uniref:PWWP domain-containing protein n=1 Tax=Erpetoichthys calabaricus TaxID=27687 RepID=A0A8C4XH71_ERPCA